MENVTRKIRSPKVPYSGDPPSSQADCYWGDGSDQQHGSLDLAARDKRPFQPEPQQLNGVEKDKKHTPNWQTREVLRPCPFDPHWTKTLSQIHIGHIQAKRTLVMSYTHTQNLSHHRAFHARAAFLNCLAGSVFPHLPGTECFQWQERAAKEAHSTDALPSLPH